MSPEGWLAITQITVTIVGAAVTIFTLIYKNRKVAEKVAVKVEEAVEVHNQTVDAQTAELKGDVGEVKRIVNGEREVMVAKIAQLEADKAHLEAAVNRGKEGR